MKIPTSLVVVLDVANLLNLLWMFWPRLAERRIRDWLWNFRYANDPILFTQPRCGVLRGRIVSRDDDEIRIELDFRYYALVPDFSADVGERLGKAGNFDLLFGKPRLRLVDEGLTWVRGQEGEAADAFRATVTMT